MACLTTRGARKDHTEKRRLRGEDTTESDEEAPEMLLLVSLLRPPETTSLHRSNSRFFAAGRTRSPWSFRNSSARSYCSDTIETVRPGADAPCNNATA